MPMSAAITYEEFLNRATQRYGEDWAQQHAANYGRLFAQDCREEAATADPEDAAALHRVADKMDPDLRAVGDRSGPDSRA